MRRRTSIKHISLTSVMVVILAVLLYILFFCTFPAYQNASENGRILGEETGRKVGVYTGSVKGIQNGVEQSRNTEHTIAETAESLKRTAAAAGKMCLLSQTISDSSVPENAENESSKGTTAVFTVDLGNAEVTVTGDTSLILRIPNPECHIYRNSDNTEAAAANGIIDESIRREARQTALSRTEKLAETVCGKKYICSVEFTDQKGGGTGE
ncbi:hypothetical protein [Ruminococcus sp. HUN007]|uniref:hypothetical protein n=1 Tax=Ruminococcus sp. HUN007 TaxID=1514668 RepID=UPI0005D18D3B|nr:hypothetical protein [Ruminococcus sp. HUN007]